MSKPRFPPNTPCSWWIRDCISEREAITTFRARQTINSTRAGNFLGRSRGIGRSLMHARSHPGPLPRGEGESSPAGRRNGRRRKFVARALLFSLLGERVRVRAAVNSILVWIFFVAAARGGESESPAAAPKFLGSQSCASSSCHGGAGDISKQFTVWSQYDFHHHRPFATLETARSERLADVLKIGKPTESARCTVCHAPFQTVPPERLGKDAKVNEGVSCESCHGPAENWLRSHTRRDYTHADRVAAGMRDLKNLYVRANTCVACHQNVPSDLLNAGHPELIFELDGQAVTQPKHWRKELDKPGPQLWLVGQAVALREMLWRFPVDGLEVVSPFNAPSRSMALEWVVSRSASALGMDWVPTNGAIPESSFREKADQVAHDVAKLDWNTSLTRKCLARLSDSSADFSDKSIHVSIHARRAERLVLALDRLTLALPAAKNDAVNAALNRLFADAQSVPDFDPNQFAKDLKEFHSRVSGVLESKKPRPRAARLGLTRH